MLWMILDLDGTLCDHRHRLKLVEGPCKSCGGAKENHPYYNQPEEVCERYRRPSPDYEAFHALCSEDECHRAIKALVLAWTVSSLDGHGVCILTGRTEPHRAATEDWLRKNGIPWDMLLMRGEMDKRSSPEMKTALIRSLRGEGYRFMFALEDRADVAEAFTKMGITTLEVRHAD